MGYTPKYNYTPPGPLHFLVCILAAIVAGWNLHVIVVEHRSR